MIQANLTRGPVDRTILNLMLPMILGMMGMILFNLVDTFFIGKLGTLSLAAMGFTLPVVMFQGSISMGLGVGAAAVIARLIGEKNHQQVKRTTTDALILSVIIVVVFVIIGLLTMNPLFKAMGASEETLPLVKEYMFIWYLGVPFVVIPMVGNNAIRAAGNTLIPSGIMLSAVLVNLVLDPMLIFGYGPFPAMGMAGAALATVIARCTTLILSLTILHKKFDMISFLSLSPEKMFRSWKMILYIGLPAAITQIILPLSTGVITRMVSGFGQAAVAGLGVSSRVEMLALSPISALASIMVPFCAQNLGAGEKNRVKEGFFFSFKLSLGIGVGTAILMIFLGKGIGGIFNQDPEVISIVGLYLLIVSPGYGLQGGVMIGASVFNALKQPFSSALLNLIRMFVLYIPLGLTGARFFGLPGIFAGALVSMLITGILARVWLSRRLRSET